MGLMVNYKGFMGYYKLAKHDTVAAKRYFEEAYAKGLSKSSYLTAYATLLLQEKNYEKALEVFRKAYHAADATSQIKWSIKANLATCYFKLDEKDQALEIAEELYENQKNGTAYVLYGYFLLNAGKTEEALAVNLKGYEYDDEDAPICDNLGQTYYAMGDFENAEKYFTKALDIKDDMIDSLYFMAEIFCKKEKYNRAYELLEEALDAPVPALATVTKEKIQQKMQEIKSLCSTTLNEKGEEVDD